MNMQILFKNIFWIKPSDKWIKFVNNYFLLGQNITMHKNCVGETLRSDSNAKKRPRLEVKL